MSNRTASSSALPARRRLFAVTAAAGLVAVGGVACLTQQDAGSATTTGATTTGTTTTGALPPAPFPDPGMAHVHGLGVDPADGTLYAATHSGLFALPADGSEPSRVANRHQDTMGFTVVGPNTFLGSGHPDFREDDEPRLGLIESTDAGETWRPLSLRGEADFHALEAAHGLVYGYEAGTGRFMVSEDGEQWEVRSALPMRDFAVSPTDSQTVLATTERGLARSKDGGRTWEPTDSPGLAVLAWSSAAGLYGIAPDGTVHHSPDGGTSWTARGRVGGPPEAVVVDRGGSEEEVLYVAVVERGIVQSTDGGRTFSTRHAG